PGDAPVWLPLDAKFPLDDYTRLVEAQERADPEAAEAAARALEARIRACAQEVSTKYLNPPHTTDFAILFLPTEGLYAEVVRRTGLVDRLQRECRVVIAGPTTLWALLNSLQMGFRTLAIQKRSSEVWTVLGAVKTEFGKFGGVIARVQKKLEEASRSVDDVGVRTRAIDRKLRGVEQLADTEAARVLLGPGAEVFPAVVLDGVGDEDGLEG
ncbi:MAG TPA: DNA recombination protein RmuC, partial [Longimicrobiaceae bacterium]|nr:DNA recombination protein RmuC [Longimicrobiaceae bacterium]